MQNKDVSRARFFVVCWAIEPLLSKLRYKRKEYLISTATANQSNDRSLLANFT